MARVNVRELSDTDLINGIIAIETRRGRLTRKGTKLKAEADRRRLLPSADLLGRGPRIIYTKESDVLHFGKCRGESIGSVIENDPSYIEWCKYNIPDFQLSGELEDLLEEAMNARAYDDLDDYWGPPGEEGDPWNFGHN